MEENTGFLKGDIQQWFKANNEWDTGDTLHILHQIAPY